MMSNFSEEAQNVLNGAREEMVELRHPYIGTEHLILSILRVDNEIRERFNAYDISYDSYRDSVIERAPVGEKIPNTLLILINSSCPNTNKLPSC